MSDVPIRFSRPIRKRLMAASKMKSAGQMLGLLGGLKGADFAPVAPGVAEFSTGEVMGHSADRLCSSEFCRSRLLSVALCVSLHGRAAAVCMYVCIYIHKFICMHIVCMYVYIYINSYVCICMHTYIRIFCEFTVDTTQSTEYIYRHTWGYCYFYCKIF